MELPQLAWSCSEDLITAYPTQEDFVRGEVLPRIEPGWALTTRDMDELLTVCDVMGYYDGFVYESDGTATYKGGELEIAVGIYPKRWWKAPDSEVYFLAITPREMDELMESYEGQLVPVGSANAYELPA